MNSENEANVSNLEQPIIDYQRNSNTPGRNMREERRQSEIIEPLDGCLIIGNNDNKYFTLNLTDFAAQATLISSEVVNGEYFPCCRKKVKETSSIVWSVLGVFRNELFLYCLHLIVICLGVIKESMVVKGGENTDDAKLVYTSVETTTTAILIFMRTLNASIAYTSSRQGIDHIGFFRSDGGLIEAAVSVRRFFRLYLVAAGVLLLLCTTTFVACLSVDQLEWTLLSNIICIVTVNLLSSLYAVRVSRAMDWVREDAHRVALLEAVTLIRTSSMDSPNSLSDVATSELRETAPAPLPRTRTLLEQYAEAVECSVFFQRPQYICIEGASQQPQQAAPDICQNG